MASNTLTDQFIALTYQGLIHSDGRRISETGVDLMYGGEGDITAFSLGRADEGAVFTGNLSTTASLCAADDGWFAENNVRIQNDGGVGRVGIGTSTPTGHLHIYNTTNPVFKIANTAVVGSIEIGTNNAMQMRTAGNHDIEMYTSNQLRGVWESNGGLNVKGDITAFWTSDRRLKENIEVIEGALEKVDRISGVTFDWTESPDHNRSGRDIGVIAQEVEAIAPEAVVTREDGYLAVDQRKLIPLLIEAIKSLKYKVEELEQQIK